MSILIDVKPEGKTLNQSLKSFAVGSEPTGKVRVMDLAPPEATTRAPDPLIFTVVAAILSSELPTERVALYTFSSRSLVKWKYWIAVRRSIGKTISLPTSSLPASASRTSNSPCIIS